MKRNVKEFIEENINLIENNQWEKIYEKTEILTTGEIGEFTTIMLKATINPLDYLNYIPKFYLYDSSISGKFNIPDNFKSIGGYAFYNCTNLTSMTIPDSVTSIGGSAFSRCRSLTSIIIPDSVTSVDDYAFSRCNSLTNITYKGTKAQWENIEKGEHWNKETPLETIHCKDGDIQA